MAKENKPGEEFDIIFSQNDSLELSSHGDYESAPTRIFKIIVIGDSNVGKTCLTYRFCGGTFLKNPEATIGVDFREKALELDGESIKVRRPANLHFNVPGVCILQDIRGHLAELRRSAHRGETELQPEFTHSEAGHGDGTAAEHRPTSLKQRCRPTISQ